MVNKVVENTGNAGITILKGVGIAFALTLISVFIYSAVLTYTNIPESTIFPVIIMITALSILIGSSISTIKIKRNGIVNGGIIGLMYILLLYIISSIVNADFAISMSSLAIIGAAILGGMLGGIVGVNIKWCGRNFCNFFS